MPYLEKILYVNESPPYRERALYAGVVNAADSRTFIILPAGSSVSDINTALSNYEVVYLSPGTYTIDGTITVTNRDLVGIGLPDFASGFGVIFTASSDIGATWISLHNGTIENVAFSYTGSASSLSYNIITGDSSDYSNKVDKVAVICNNAQSQYAFYGRFQFINKVRTYQIDGAYLSGGKGSFGHTTLNYFQIYAAPTYGVRIAQSGVTITNGEVDGFAKTTDYGIYFNESTTYTHHIIDSVYLIGPTEGIHYEYTTNRPWDVSITNCQVYGATTGLYLAGLARSQIANLDIDSCTTGLIMSDMYFSECNGVTIAYGQDRGLYVSGMTSCAISNVESFGHNNTSGSTYGNYFIYAANRCAFSNFTSQEADNTSNAGIYFNTCAGCSITGMVDFQSYVGIAIDSCTNCSVSSITAYDADNIGVYFGTNTRLAISAVAAYTCGAYGIQFNNCDYCSASSMMSCDNVTYGVYVVDCDRSAFSTIMSYNNSGTGIYVVTSTYCTMDGASIVANTSRGLYVNGASDCAFANMISYYHNGTSGATYGNYYIYGSNYCSFSNLASREADNTTNAGIYVSTCSGCSFSSLSDYQSYYSLYVTTCNGCSVSSVVAYDADNYGIVFNDCDRTTAVGLTAYSCGSIGIYFNDYDYSTASGLSANDNANYNFYIANSNNSSFYAMESFNISGVGLYATTCTDITINGVVAYTSSSYGIQLVSITRAVLSSLMSYAATSYGIYLSTVADSTGSSWLACAGTNSGIVLATVTKCAFSSIVSRDNRGNSAYDGFSCTGTADLSIDGAISYYNEGRGFDITGSHCTFTGCNAYDNDQDGFYLASCGAAKLIGGGSRANNLRGVYINSAYVIVTGMWIAANGTGGTYHGLEASTLADRCIVHGNVSESHAGASEYGFYLGNVSNGSSFMDNLTFGNTNTWSIGSNWSNSDNTAA